MAKATSATAAKTAVAAPKVKKELTELQLAEQASDKKRAKKLYTSGYWDAVRGVRTSFGEGSKNGEAYDKGHVAGTTALANGKVGWTPKRAPKDIPGRTILARQDADAAIGDQLVGSESTNGEVADQDAQERVLEADGLGLSTASVEPITGPAVDEDALILVTADAG